MWSLANTAGMRLEEFCGCGGRPGPTRWTSCSSRPGVGRNGIERHVDIDISPEEVDGLRRSAAVLKETFGELTMSPFTIQPT